MNRYGNAVTTGSSRLPIPPQELPRFKELIFEDFSRFLLVENLFEEVVLQSVSKDIMMGEGKKTLDLEMNVAWQ